MNFVKAPLEELYCNSLGTWNKKTVIIFRKIRIVTPQFPGLPLTNRQPAEISTLGHLAPKSWYSLLIDTELLGTTSIRPFIGTHSFIFKLKYENNALNYSP